MWKGELLFCPFRLTLIYMETDRSVLVNNNIFSLPFPLLCHKSGKFVIYASVYRGSGLWFPHLFIVTRRKENQISSHATLGAGSCKFTSCSFGYPLFGRKILSSFCLVWMMKLTQSLYQCISEKAHQKSLNTVFPN